jgi:thioredoxin 1
VLYAQPGALPEKALEELITKAEAIDMDEVRASVAQAQAESATRAEAPAAGASAEAAPAEVPAKA